MRAALSRRKYDICSELSMLEEMDVSNIRGGIYGIMRPKKLTWS